MLLQGGQLMWRCYNALFRLTTQVCHLIKPRLYEPTTFVLSESLSVNASLRSLKDCAFLQYLAYLTVVHWPQCLLMQAGPYDNLKDVALKILQNEVATVPIIISSSEDGSFPQLLHLASLAGILKCKLFN